EFEVARGIRQGDLFSPFLIILATEGLNTMVNEEVEKGIFRGVSEEEMARWMGCDIGEFPFTYLGLPIGENMRRVVISNNRKDRWRWLLGGDGDGDFKVKDLSSLIEENILHPDGGGRLPVRVEQDRRGVDLDSVLCPCCNNIVEMYVHSLITCDLAMSVWDKIYKWWKVRIVNAFSIDEFFSSNGNVNVPTFISRVWQAVIWSTGYFIWKERNARVFENKISSANKIVQYIQLKSYE
nr:reverse transcriptase domain, reverse transcriptase zinc-binding domain protein [Tanacetum cinerariifolium]